MLLGTQSLCAGTVSLRVLPASPQADVGQTLALEIRAESGQQPADVVELYLDYDPTLLQVVDAAGVATKTIESGDALPRVFANRVDAVYGWVDYLASSLGATPPSGEFIVARLRVKVLKAETAWVRFSFSDWRTTDVAYHGMSVLGVVEAAQIRALSQHLAFLPMMLKRP